MSGSVNMKEARVKPNLGAPNAIRESSSNTPIPSLRQQRDALLIICIPCTDSEREEGSYKVIPKTTLVAQRQCFRVRVWEGDDKSRSEGKGTLEGGLRSPWSKWRAKLWQNMVVGNRMLTWRDS